jgi:hypothetical protein
LGDAAGAGMLLSCRCDLCRRTRIYLASDLAEIYGGKIDAMVKLCA